MTQNLKDCKEILDSLDTGKEDSEPHRYEWHYRNKGVHLLDQAEKAFQARNDLVHRAWSVADAAEPSGYKTPPPRRRDVKDKLARPYRAVSKDEINTAIAGLVQTVEALDRFAGEPQGPVDRDAPTKDRITDTAREKEPLPCAGEIGVKINQCSYFSISTSLLLMSSRTILLEGFGFLR
ncbi:hypothetical protein [Paenarthrobacter sp. PH39-S1]|uniref:hypothetical protein n=1 Tax=Paenarthrobacter sp. PH39-S1 TaxID=3046204 RepID=UPI0024BA4712|nr:hypothetical protein [Paenarthrobacter sp. PH39-S1]MDJ0358447.1 hypothetical protein [Paenarthrobacter sp. PH39-S1]